MHFMNYFVTLLLATTVVYGGKKSHSKSSKSSKSGKSKKCQLRTCSPKWVSGCSSFCKSDKKLSFEEAGSFCASFGATLASKNSIKKRKKRLRHCLKKGFWLVADDGSSKRVCFGGKFKKGNYGKKCGSKLHALCERQPAAETTTLPVTTPSATTTPPPTTVAKTTLPALTCEPWVPECVASSCRDPISVTYEFEGEVLPTDLLAYPLGTNATFVCPEGSEPFNAREVNGQLGFSICYDIPIQGSAGLQIWFEFDVLQGGVVTGGCQATDLPCSGPSCPGPGPG